jgi:protein phosphatase 2C family protein 2/3
MIAGIWDCLSSQDVVCFVRYQVSKGKELTEIGGMLCDHCLAPDTDSEYIGCDNMTVLIVAITHGRSKEEWYTWITKRVKDRYVYEMRKALPELYSQSRRDAFRTKKEIHVRHQKEKLEAERNASTSALSAPSPTQAASSSEEITVTH